MFDVSSFIAIIQPPQTAVIAVGTVMSKPIVVEDKIKHETREYNRGQIFKYGDELTDSMIEYLERMRERTKKAS